MKHDLLSSMYEYTGQSDILDEINNRRRRFVAQSLLGLLLLLLLIVQRVQHEQTTQCIENTAVRESYRQLCKVLRLFHCYHLPSLSHCFTLSLKPTFSENLILHLSLFLSVGLISWL